MSEYTHQSVIGKLTSVPHGGPDGSIGYFFEKEDETFLTVKFVGGFADARTVPLNEKIALCMSVVEIDGFHVVCTHKPFYTVIAQPMMLEASNGKIKKHIGIFRQLPLTTTEEARAKQLVRTQEQAKSVQEFYRYYGNKVWDVEVRGYVMLGESSAHPPYYARSDVTKYMNEHDMEGFEPNYFHVNGGYSEGYCGQGNKPGNRSVTYINYVCGVKTMIHELGHNLNLHHASTFDGVDKLVEYGDKTSVMGSAQSVSGFNSVNVIQLGFEDEREIKHITETQQILICPIELTKHGMHENEYQNVIFKSGTKTFHVSIRKIKGGQYYSGESDESMLYIHESTRDTHSIRYPSLRYPGPNVRRTLPGGVVVEYLEYANETARVNIIFSGDSKPDDIPMPVGFPAALPSVSIGPEHNGAWYDKDYTGEGLDLHVKDDKMVLYWYTYNVKQRSRRFYFAACSLTDGLNEFDIMTTEDGTWADPTLYTPKTVGKGQLYFFDGTRGVFNWNTDEHGRGSMEVTPVALSNHPSTGSYYQPSRDGEGFTIQFFDHLDSVTAFWYSYGPIERGTGYNNYKGNMKQRWYVCSGKKTDDGSYDLKVYEATDNMWMHLRDEPNVHEVGTAKIVVNDVDNITFDYDINADNVTGKGTYELIRLF